MKKSEKIMRYVLVVLHALTFLIFGTAVYRLGMLPEKYFAGLIVLLVILWCVGLFSLIRAKKHGVFGKLYCVLLIVVFCYGSLRVFETVDAMKTISSRGGEQVAQHVVAVLKDDPAQTIEDAADYQFGVQYVLKGGEIRRTVAEIEKETGRTLAVKEYDSIQEQLTALYAQEVNAIIFDEAFSELLEEEMPELKDSIRILTSYTVHREMKIVQPEEKSVKKDQNFAVYISGIDVYGSIRKTSRSDVNIIAFVNPKSHQILLVTTPRDYYIPLPGISGEKKDKLTHAGIYGVDVSMAALEQLYETEIEYYARVNFTSLIETVDALGGVDVNSEVAFDSGDFHVVKGMNHFNGEQALAFSRNRYQVAGGDFQRGRDQQAVITAMIRKMISPAILSGAGEIIESVSKNVDTNMSYEKMQELVKNQLDHPVSWNIKSMAAEGKGDRQETYSMPGRSLYVAQPVQESVDEIKEAVNALEKGEILENSTVVEK